MKVDAMNNAHTKATHLNKRTYLRSANKQIFEDDFENKQNLDNDTMEKEEIFRALADCGLSEYESKVYTSLVFLGASKAGVISRESNVPQSKIYEVLDQLTNKQLVEVFDGRPKEFKATEPETALKNLIEEKTKEIGALRDRINEISSFLKPIKREETLEGIWSIKGEKFKEFFNKTAEMLNRAESYVYAITRDFSRSSTMVDGLRKCVKRGVKIRAIGMEKINEKNYYKARWYHDHGIELRIFETKIHPRIIVVDGKELLLRLDYNPQKRNNFRFNSLWSEDPSLIAVIDSYVKNMWKNAETVDFKKIPTPA
jgi:sugar-specific transcriptional regulator TrmB